MNHFKVLLTGIAILLSARYSYAYFHDVNVVTSNTFVSGVFSVVTPTSSVYVPQAGDIVVNEINWGGSRVSTSDEWVELRNMQNREIDMSGWTIENLGSSSASATLTIAQGKNIPPLGFFLIANTTKASSKINVDPDVTTTGISLLDSGEELRLRASNGALIDTANRNGSWFKGAKTPAFRSMERKDIPGSGTDQSNWQDAITHTGMDGNTTVDEYGTPKGANGL